MRLPCAVVLCLIFTQTRSSCSDGYSIKCDNLADVKSYGNPNWVSLVIGDIDNVLPPNETLHGQEFSSCPNLEELTIIAAINGTGFQAFDNLPNLSVLKLYKNYIGTLSNSVLLTMPHLSRLDLQDNNIEQLNNVSWSPVNSSNLITLNLSHNKLSELVVATFKVPSLKRLIITHNGLWKLGPRIFPPNLEYLNLKHNHLPEIGENVLTGMDNLKELILSYNEFVRFWSIYTLTNLERLDLSHNKISSIGPYVFDGMPKLLELRLNHNHLGDLPVDIFQINFRQLKIKYLHLHNNMFKNMEFLVNRIWAELVELSIINNYWPCDCLNQFLTTTIAQSQVRLSSCEQSFFRNGDFPVCVVVKTTWNDGKCTTVLEKPPLNVYARLRKSSDSFRCKVGSL